MDKVNRIVVLAPHTDDGEFGCGATLSRYIEEGAECYYAAFSSCDESVPEGLPKDILRKEVKAATKVLGIPDANLLLYNFRVRHFPEFRQGILEEMVKIQREIQPDLVFLPSTFDTHQDHNVVSQEGFRAFKKSSMYGYELPWNHLHFVSSGFIEVSKDHLANKIEALKCYESQANRTYASEEYIRSLAFTRGVQCGIDYAEVYEVIRDVRRLK